MTTRESPGLAGKVRTLASSYRRILGTAGVQALSTFLGLFSGVMIARTLGADGRGAISAVMVILTVLGWLVFLGTPNAAGYMSERARSSVVSTAAVMAGTLGAVAGVVLWFCAPAFVHGYPDVVQNGVRVVAVLLPLVGFAVCGQEIAYAEDRVRLWNLLRAIPLAGPSIGVLILAGFGALTVPHAIAVYLGATVVHICLGTSVLVARLTVSVSKPAVAVITRYALPRWMSAASDALTARMDQLVMVALSTPSELGRYAVAVTVVSVSTPLSMAVGMMMYPQTKNTTDTDDLVRLHRSMRRRTVILSSVAGTVVVVAAAPLIGLLFGPDFRGLEPILILLVIAQIFNDRYYVDISYFAGIGRPDVLIVPSWITAGCALAGLLLVGRNGLTGVEAAAVAATCAAVRCVGMTYATRRHERRADSTTADVV